jgi:DNA replication initiation complex subunit (GINS family)
MSKSEESTLELLKRYLDSETTSDRIGKLPNDLYSKLAAYCQSLRRTTSANGDDLSSRLIKKQITLIEGMINQLLQARMDKVISGAATDDLLPEEKHVSSLYLEFRKRQQRFIGAIVNGQPSFFAMAHRNEMSRQVTVRFSKSIGEVIGFDLKRYGPFKTHDIALVPSANADVFVANGEAVLVSEREAP